MSYLACGKVLIPGDLASHKKPFIFIELAIAALTYHQSTIRIFKEHNRQVYYFPPAASGTISSTYHRTPSSRLVKITKVLVLS